MFISFKKMFNMLKDIDNNTNEITELKKAIKKLQSDKQPQSGTWLYAGNEVAGYLTSNGEFLDIRPKGDTI